ncbi:hypothetical protein C0J52_18637 [Blattella germanica]|nr:hypothetical protein C0J52_18637 [Blattella germanica]
MKTFPESPRWLAMKGKTKKCLKVLQQIARENGTTIPANAYDVLNKLKGMQEKGMYVDVRYPYAILGALCMLGIICCLLLPETMNQRLPETIQDSAHFGKDQSFWYFPWRNKDKKYQPPTLQNGLS